MYITLTKLRESLVEIPGDSLKKVRFCRAINRLHTFTAPMDDSSLFGSVYEPTQKLDNCMPNAQHVISDRNPFIS